jgi:D-alanine-D-alanine ligase-like ATP-grasp enzyme
LLANISPEQQRGINEALGYAQTIGYPIFVKPNNMSQGAFVTKARNEVQVIETMRQIFVRTDVVLLEEPCAGRDYRVVVLGDKIISAYERRPLAVIGDGVSSIEELLHQAKTGLADYGRPNSEIDLSDPRIEIRLGALGIIRDSVPLLHEEVTLLDNANLSTGGTSVDVTDLIHPEFAAIAISASHTIGLRLSGVDFICADLSQKPSNQDWNIIEINAAPGLDNYSSLGHLQAERVRNLYREVLRYLATHDV